MPVEEFKMFINSDVKSFLDEEEAETLEKAAHLADDYTLTHKPFYPLSAPKPRPSLPSSNSSHITAKPNILVKTKVTILYLSLFTIIANNQAIFIAGCPKAAFLFWFFGDFRCGVLLFMVILLIYKYKNR